jgi:hypothetical protein
MHPPAVEFPKSFKPHSILQVTVIHPQKEINTTQGQDQDTQVHGESSKYHAWWIAAA